MDVLAGIVGAKDVRDAIKALKNSDWIQFTFEVSELVLNNTPIGKFLKIIDAGSDMYRFAKKVEKLWDKISGYTDTVVESMWNIVSKYADDIKVNSDVVDGILRTIKRGVKSLDDLSSHANNIGLNITQDRIKHILRGDGWQGGLHHISGLVDDQDVIISNVVSELSQNGIKYRKVRLKRKLGNNYVELGDEKTFFPDSWNEEEILNAVKSAFDSKVPITNKLYEIGTYNGFSIRLYLNPDGSISTAFPN